MILNYIKYLIKSDKQINIWNVMKKKARNEMKY